MSMLDPSPLDQFRLDDRVVIVTGASSGLGRRFALVAASAGAKVVVAARRRDRLEAPATELPNAHVVEVDLTSADGPQHVVDEAIDAYGRIDVVVNSAGKSSVVPALEFDEDQMARELAINLIAPFAVTRLAAATMIDSGHSGAIVNIGSVLGSVAGGKVKVPGYAAAKGGLHQLTRELASEWAHKQIRVNAIAPSWFETEMTGEAMFDTDAGMRYITENTPMRRAGREDELDGALLFLASDASSYVTGHVLFVDGGWTAV
jgi:NAD(P)-dependent dehydrogenase (short-subunit alcohol dehydrogenase family)